MPCVSFEPLMRLWFRSWFNLLLSAIEYVLNSISIVLSKLIGAMFVFCVVLYLPRFFSESKNAQCTQQYKYVWHHLDSLILITNFNNCHRQIPNEMYCCKTMDGFWIFSKHVCSFFKSQSDRECMYETYVLFLVCCAFYWSISWRFCTIKSPLMKTYPSIIVMYIFVSYEKLNMIWICMWSGVHEPHRLDFLFMTCLKWAEHF